MRLGRKFFTGENCFVLGAEGFRGEFGFLDLGANLDRDWKDTRTS